MYWRVYGYDYTDVRECVCKYASTFVRLPHARMDFIYAFNVYIGAGTQAFAAPAFPTGHRRRLRPAVRGCARFCVRFCFGGGCWREGVGWTSWYHAAYSLCSEELQQHARWSACLLQPRTVVIAPTARHLRHCPNMLHVITPATVLARMTRVGQERDTPVTVRHCPN